MTGVPTRVTDRLLDVIESLLDANDHELHGWAIIKASRRTGPTVSKSSNGSPT
jgi:PadR family transcriptional regulator PadR